MTDFASVRPLAGLRAVRGYFRERALVKQREPMAADPAAGGEPVSAEPGTRANDWPLVDRRRHADRRNQPTGVFGAFAGKRRRRRGRRSGEQQDIYVDVFHKSDVLLLVGIFVLNILDALFTLLWLQRGGGEGNPVMAFMLDLGDWAFIAQKCFVVGLWLLLLVVHKNFRLARLGLYSAASLYALLILYHFALLTSGVEPGVAHWGPTHGRLE